jgi:4-hydroxybenzoate polyprenyltransferase
MRLAVLIITLCLTGIVGLQSCTIAAGGSLLKDQDAAGGGAVGLLIALLFVLGAAFVMGLPRVSMVLFAIAGFLGLGIGATSSFTDLKIWGGLSLVLAVMSWFGSRELRRKQVAPQAGSLAQT